MFRTIVAKQMTDEKLPKLREPAVNKTDPAKDFFVKKFWRTSQFLEISKII